MQALVRERKPRAHILLQPAALCLLVALVVMPMLPAQTPAPPQAAPAPVPATPISSGPIAIVPLDNKNPDQAPTVTGALEVAGGKAIIAASGAVTSGSTTTEVVLPHRGTLRVCASTTVKLAADSAVPSGETPGLMMALDHGAIEASFATGRNADVLLTPDFRILIGGPGAAEVKVRLGQHGDTCVDNPRVPSDRSSSLGWNSGADAPYVLVTSVFDGSVYRVQPGQRVMFQHGSLTEVVDQEKEPCGCPPPPGETHGNEFPLAQSEGLAPVAASVPAFPHPSDSPAIAPLVFKSPEPAPETVAQPAAAASASASPAAAPPTAQKRPGFFRRVGHFFRVLFGAE